MIKNVQAARARSAQQQDSYDFGGEGPDGAMNLCHPQSPLAGDPVLLTNLLNYLDKHLDVWFKGERLVDQFHSPNPHRTYMLLSAVYPDLIPPSLKTKWDTACTRQADDLVKRRGGAFLSPSGHCNTNHDIHYVHALYCAARLLNKPEYIKYAEGGLKMIERQWLADGAFEYNENAMPVLFYHGLCTWQLANIWLLSGNPLAKDLIVRQWWYFPLELDDRWGLSNYSLSVGYKQYQELAPRGQMEFCYYISSVSGSRENYALAENEIKNARFWVGQPSLFQAQFYRNDLTPLPLPDN